MTWSQLLKYGCKSVGVNLLVMGLYVEFWSLWVKSWNTKIAVAKFWASSRRLGLGAWPLKIFSASCVFCDKFGCFAVCGGVSFRLNMCGGVAPPKKLVISKKQYWNHNINIFSPTKELLAIIKKLKKPEVIWRHLLVIEISCKAKMTIAVSIYNPRLNLSWIPNANDLKSRK